MMLIIQLMDVMLALNTLVDHGNITLDMYTMLPLNEPNNESKTLLMERISCLLFTLLPQITKCHVCSWVLHVVVKITASYIYL
jgi:hypothetical protein